ncbi:MAG: hypothetical protein BRD50_02530 [Bacteroidetes bacterium SW_11_45_7]|nr:MAG: hypothetical protein BRD50_02530 [Bacteroidetes bacterium SW_11_45_7]
MQSLITFTLTILTILLSFSASAQLLDDEAPDFSRKDTLRGALRPERTCYDVRHYDLNVKVDPGHQFLKGHNTITYYTNSTFDTIQVDLFKNMNVDKITHHGEELAYNREYNAVFIAFPDEQPADRLDSLTFHYSGKPKVAENPPWDGGLVWDQA